MNLIGKKFQNKSGKIVVVKESNERFTTFEDNSKVDTRYLLDKKYFVELPIQQIQQPQQNISFTQMDRVDPNQFFNQKNPLLEQISSIPTEVIGKMRDDAPAMVASAQTNFYPPDNTSAILQSDPELEKLELARKYGASVQNETLGQINKQANAFMANPLLAKILEEEGEIAPQAPPQPPVQQKPYVPPVQETQVYQENNRATSTQIEPVVEQKSNPMDSYIDPIISMFKKAKRNTDFKISFDVNNKIPRLDFIEMMEESYETSIIEFLAQEFTNQLLSNPSIIRDKIKDGIKKMLEKNSKKENIDTEEKPVAKKTAPRKTTVKK